MIHRRKHPNLDVEGCFGCKASSINFGTVPGARKDSTNQVSRLNRREQELFAYREARRAGEQPDNTTFEGIEAARKRRERWDRTEEAFTDTNPPEMVKQMEKSYTNVAT